MLFSSPEFIFAFLPVTLIVYFLLSSSQKVEASRLWLLVASLFFYGWWNPANLILIGVSMIFNFTFGNLIIRHRKKWLLTVGVSANLAVLFYYKYANFFLTNFNGLFEGHYALLNVVLPLGVSFFTFTQIAYLVDSSQGKVGNYKFSHYCLFVTFFPHLIAGPIVHHTQLMPQFADQKNAFLNFPNLARGFFIFNLGLAKKIIVADTLSTIVAKGYGDTAALTTVQAWVTSLAYSTQLYFDFSGYSDMAIGLGLLFNIDFPLNFNSPYKSKNIQEFWRRWHITLSQFLRDYIYIPLGGNRKGEWGTASNLMITFILGGIWHGAGWTFIFWGFLHGAALVIHRQFTRLNLRMADWLGVVLTFLYVNVTWVFFRAPSWRSAIDLLKAMVGKGVQTSDVSLVSDYYMAPIWIAAAVLLFTKNTNELGAEFKPDYRRLATLIIVVMLNLLFLNSATNQEFLYFDF
ncbi:D-alanyl-lipoteichoic acid acyltransferase DltB, MBOAT superfamily [Chryseolinea serpens]|uniref:D-alanyl-lipoteichoic acid acyltransferase DltB, MBOAT superfamily n=1 Tax=Chryseolinea serpens TaxID=947013 RepID=A0A1M5VUA4_9BACT|nr:MBOAT family protein [Chryseolinea serpens]SHH78869.1 D-alanyl-lipoteichoic acid acyltransferase DltB, MBOAT superfamily [Chryseolinea serpens]